MKEEKKVNQEETKTSVGKYLKAARGGKKVNPSKRSPLFRELELLSEVTPSKKPKPGILRGKFTVPENFNSSLPEFETSFYGE